MVARTLLTAWITRPATVVFPTLMIIPGLGALIFGDRVSKVFTELGGGLSVRVVGATLTLGCLLVTLGITRRDIALEVMGIVSTTVGCALFGCAAFIAQGTLAILPGSLALSSAIAFTGRVRKLIRESNVSESDSG